MLDLAGRQGALGLGTMVGWKRVVVTVGEKIGKRPTVRPS
jgi:phosphate/sulfate permease